MKTLKNYAKSIKKVWNYLDYVPNCPVCKGTGESSREDEVLTDKSNNLEGTQYNNLTGITETQYGPTQTTQRIEPTKIKTTTEEG